MTTGCKYLLCLRGWCRVLQSAACMLSALSRLKNLLCTLHEFSVHVTWGRGMVLWRQHSMLSTPISWMKSCLYIMEHMWCTLRLTGGKAGRDRAEAVKLHPVCVAFCWLTSLYHKLHRIQWSLAVEANCALCSRAESSILDCLVHMVLTSTNY